MNERIRELAEQAGFETDRGPLIVPGPYIKVGGLCVGVPLEKFAELIVKECAGIYDKIDNGNAHEGTEDYLYALKRHFDL
jgi:hypothetical protein